MNTTKPNTKTNTNSKIFLPPSLSSPLQRSHLLGFSSLSSYATLIFISIFNLGREAYVIIWVDVVVFSWFVVSGYLLNLFVFVFVA